MPGLFQNCVLDGTVLTILVPATFPNQIAVGFQLLNANPDAVHAVLTDTGQPSGGIVPILRQGEHERQQPLGLQGQCLVPQMVVGHNGVISGLFDAEYSHFRTSLYYRVVVISVPLQGHVLHCKGCCGSVYRSYRKTVPERLQPQPFTVLLIS